MLVELERNEFRSHPAARIHVRDRNRSRDSDLQPVPRSQRAHRLRGASRGRNCGAAGRHLRFTQPRGQQHREETLVDLADPLPRSHRHRHRLEHCVSVLFHVGNVLCIGTVSVLYFSIVFLYRTRIS